MSFANHHYTDFALVWVERARRAGIHNFIIGAMDDKVLVSLAKRGINTFSMKSGGWVCGWVHEWMRAWGSP